MTNNSNADRDNVRWSLMALHRALLHHQKGVQEQIEKRSMAPHEVLQLSLSHPEFEWLRVLSGLILAVDEQDDNPDPNQEKIDMRSELRSLFDHPSSNPDFKRRFEAALASDPSLRLPYAAVQKHLADA